MTRQRQGLVSPDVVSTDMERARKVASELDTLARLVAKTYLELYDASLSPSNSGEVSQGKPGFRVSDPTGDVATSGMHHRMRAHARKAARRLRKAIPLLEEAEVVMVEAFNETDPDFREKLRRLREIEASQREENRQANGSG